MKFLYKGDSKPLQIIKHCQATSLITNSLLCLYLGQMLNMPISPISLFGI